MQLIRYLEDKEPLTTAAILEAWWDKDGADNLNTLASWNPHLDDDSGSIKKMFTDCLTRLGADQTKQRINALLAKDTQGPALSREEKQELKELLSQ